MSRAVWLPRSAGERTSGGMFPAQELEAPVVVFDQGRSTSDPVASVAVVQTVDRARGRRVHVSAEDRGDAPAPGGTQRRALEARRVAEQSLAPLLEHESEPCAAPPEQPLDPGAKPLEPARQRIARERQPAPVLDDVV